MPFENCLVVIAVCSGYRKGISGILICFLRLLAGMFKKQSIIKINASPSSLSFTKWMLTTDEGKRKTTNLPSVTYAYLN